MICWDITWVLAPRAGECPQVWMGTWSHMSFSPSSLLTLPQLWAGDLLPGSHTTSLSQPRCPPSPFLSGSQAPAAHPCLSKLSHSHFLGQTLHFPGPSQRLQDKAEPWALTDGGGCAAFCLSGDAARCLGVLSWRRWVQTVQWVGSCSRSWDPPPPMARHSVWHLLLTSSRTCADLMKPNPMPAPLYAHMPALGAGEGVGWLGSPHQTAAQLHIGEPNALTSSARMWRSTS